MNGIIILFLIYFREQTLDEVHIYIEPPEFLLPKNKEKFKKQL
jgi:hypothetical protein